METKECIQIKQENGVALLTIDRQEVLNALSRQVVHELDDAMRELEADGAIKAIVLTGAGEKAFVSGGDIREMLTLNVTSAKSFSEEGQRLMMFIQDMTKPVIAAVNGYALGGGLELALACDFIYAAEKARFGLPETTLGVLPGYGGTQNLARLIGPNRAKELIFTGRILTAAEALAWGIVNAVFPDGELVERSIETASRIGRNANVALAKAKQAIVCGLEQAKDEGFRIEAELFADLFATEDQKEGLNAFLAKRKPEFKGR